MNDTISLLQQHRSVRRYRDEAIPDAHILEAVQAGQAASTSSAVQSYCMIRVTDDAQRERLVEFTGGQTKVVRCGAFFVICGDVRRHRLVCERAGHEYDATLEAFLLAVIDATLFAQNLVIAFESLGYGICYIGGLRNKIAEADRLLNLPEGIYPLYGLCVGVPDEAPDERPRLAAEAVYFEGGYPTDAQMLNLIDQYDGIYRTYLADRGAPAAQTASAWSGSMASKFASARRTDLAAYYRSKGADLD